MLHCTAYCSQCFSYRTKVGSAFYHNQNEKIQVELGQWDIQKILVGEGSLIEVVGGLYLMTNCYGT